MPMSTLGPKCENLLFSICCPLLSSQERTFVGVLNVGRELCEKLLRHTTGASAPIQIPAVKPEYAPARIYSKIRMTRTHDHARRQRHLLRQHCRLSRFWPPDG